MARNMSLVSQREIRDVDSNSHSNYSNYFAGIELELLLVLGLVLNSNLNQCECGEDEHHAEDGEG